MIASHSVAKWFIPPLSLVAVPTLLTAAATYNIDSPGLLSLQTTLLTWNHGGVDFEDACLRVYHARHRPPPCPNSPAL